MIYILEFEEKHATSVAVFSTREKALAFAVAHVRELVSRNPEAYLEDVVSGRLSDDVLAESDGEDIISDWHSLSGETEYFTLNEATLDGDFASKV